MFEREPIYLDQIDRERFYLAGIGSSANDRDGWICPPAGGRFLVRSTTEQYGAPAMEALGICDAGPAAILGKGSSMRYAAAVSIALLSAILLVTSARAEVQVTFINSFRYSDFVDKPPGKREKKLTEIRNTLEDLGARYLNPGAVLKIKVLDMQRVALSIQPSPPKGENHGPSAAIQPLRLELQYVLQQDGKTILRDRETLSDINYLANPSAHAASEHDEPIDPEKQMLRDWFAERFGASAPPQ
jgi:hypothetical protein